MRGAVSRLVCKLALQGLSPIAIAQQTGRSSSNVRSMLSTARGDGVEIPKYGTAPARLVRPTSAKRLFADPLARARLTEERDDLRCSVVAFGVPWAVEYAREQGLPPWHLHATHYDILARAGARMDNFVRAPFSAAEIAG